MTNTQLDKLLESDDTELIEVLAACSVELHKRRLAAEAEASLRGTLPRLKK